MQPNGLDMYYLDTRGDAGLDDDALQGRFAGYKSAGIFWIFHQVSTGSVNFDGWFLRRRDAARKAGFKFFGGYHVLNDGDIATQAKNLAKVDDGLMAFAVRPMINLPMHRTRQFMLEFEEITGVYPKLFADPWVRDGMKSPVAHKNKGMKDVANAFLAYRDVWMNEQGPHQNIPWPWCEPQCAQKEAKGIWAWRCDPKPQHPALLTPFDAHYFCGTPDQLSNRWRIS